MKKKNDSANSNGIFSNHPILIAFTLLILFQIIGAFVPGRFTWGFNYWNIFPTPISLTLLIAGLILLVIPFGSGIDKQISKIFRQIGNGICKINPIVRYAIVSILLFALFYIFRSRAFIYGDGFLVLQNQTNLNEAFDFSLYYMKPLIVMFHRYSCALLASFLELPTHDILALVNCLGGVIGFWAIFRLAKQLSENLSTQWLLLLGTLTSGSTLLFFGYIENYTWAIAMSLWSLSYSVEYLQQSKHFGLSLLFALLALGCHIFTAPFLLAVVIARFSKSQQNSNSFFRWINIIIGILFLLVAVVFHLRDPAQYLVPLLPTAFDQYWFLSPEHLLDMLNIMILASPLAFFTLIMLFFNRKKYSSPKEIQLLATLSFIIFLTSFWINPHLGAARDWDFLSFFGFPLSLWSIYQLNKLSNLEFQKVKYLIAVTVVLLITIVPNIIEKNNLAIAVTRLDDLLLEDAHYQISSRDAERCQRWGYTLQNNVGEHDRAIRHFRRRLQARETDFQTWINIGDSFASKGMRDSAYFYVSRGAEINPENPDLLFRLAEEAKSLNHLQDAIHWAKIARQRSSDNLELQTKLAPFFYDLQQYDDAYTCFRRASVLAPKTCDHLINLGFFFGAMQQPDSAYYCLERSLELSCDDDIKIIAAKTMFEYALMLDNLTGARKALDVLKKSSIDPSELEKFSQALYKANNRFSYP